TSSLKGPNVAASAPSAARDPPLPPSVLLNSETLYAQQVRGPAHLRGRLGGGATAADPSDSREPRTTERGTFWDAWRNVPKRPRSITRSPLQPAPPAPDPPMTNGTPRPEAGPRHRDRGGAR